MVSKNYRFSEAESKPQENKTFWIPHELEHLIISKIFYRTPMIPNKEKGSQMKQNWIIFVYFYI